jgi:hypothetical protein
MKSILCFVIGTVMVFSLSYLPSTTLAQTDDIEEITGQDSQSDTDSTEEEVEILPGGEEPPPEAEELPDANGAVQDEAGDVPGDEGPVILVPEE